MITNAGMAWVKGYFAAKSEKAGAPRTVTVEVEKIHTTEEGVYPMMGTRKIDGMVLQVGDTLAVDYVYVNGGTDKIVTKVIGIR